MKQTLEFIRLHPRATQSEIVTGLIPFLSKNKTRRNIEALRKNGYLIVETGNHNAHLHTVSMKTPQPCDFPRPEVKIVSIAEKKFLYGICERENSPIKIGIAKNLRRRIDMMQTANYRQLVIVFAALTESPRDIEKSIHDLFSDRLLRGEWYDVTRDELSEAFFDMM